MEYFNVRKIVSFRLARQQLILSGCKFKCWRDFKTADMKEWVLFEGREYEIAGLGCG